MGAIDLKAVSKRYGKTEVVKAIDLAIGDGELVVIVGPSGCGKSTTLRMIAGLEEIDGGTIAIDGRIVNRIEPKARNIAMVFQNYAIYPHMTVEQNIGFGLYTAKLEAEEKRLRIYETARLLGLYDLLARKPSQLSGGQRQRVAIGRAMVRNPAAFLFDEPLSNLDAQLRGQMRIEIKKLHQRLGTTIVFVTHDQVEAMTLADRIVVMKEGVILQVGPPMELYTRPGDVFTARFIGSPTMNILAGTGTGDGLNLANGAHVSGLAVEAGRKVLLGVRPPDLRPIEGAPTQPGLLSSGNVAVVEPLGSETFLHVETGALTALANQTLIARTEATATPPVGSDITIFAPTECLHLFDATTERAIQR